MLIFCIQHGLFFREGEWGMGKEKGVGCLVSKGTKLIEGDYNYYALQSINEFVGGCPPYGGCCCCWGGGGDCPEKYC